MKKYFLIDYSESSGESVEMFETADEAIHAAMIAWDHLSMKDKKDRAVFCAAVAEENSEIEGTYSDDGYSELWDALNRQWCVECLLDSSSELVALSNSLTVADTEKDAIETFVDRIHVKAPFECSVDRIIDGFRSEIHIEDDLGNIIHSYHEFRAKEVFPSCLQ